ncbi:ead/Ea22-like family protein [Enterobacter hormaechei]|uniref:Ead/Ea22-like family protein n=1 Tax=Enterobacter hormaechei TaxID=158836 RepID=A0AAP8GP23_9ENTR|nr:ead/Ea22-like family protein [Enterobacter hormaechei]HAS1884739.1 ead/Ea22-like family protein [Enterobacter hormaechei subsp. xiangfangensis]MCM8478012.1 ead/Ea22-like family protein [Enterobacter hormaechei]MDF3588122.1 ead/Ea22-like family protein [Enterobacter hormaechei]PJG40238.1 hypothetical protein CGZ54_08435 [Enterobacter hormaechei]HBM2753135.1 ead/Ea22-like family protein [Enterobacter hormaechei subsp. xiangfangensis]
MSNIDKRALREAAEKALSAGDGNWQTWREAGMNYPEIFTSSGHIVATVNGSFAVVRSDFIAAANPATVLALLDELEASYSRIGELEVIATDYGIKFQKAQDAMKHQSLLHKSQMEAAEKRIAELEAREVVLPSTQDVHPLGPQSAKIFCEFHRSIVNRCADEIRKVGVKVSIKGN